MSVHRHEGAGAPELGQVGGREPPGRRHDRLGHDQVALGEVGRERAADAGRDHQGSRFDAGGAGVEVRGARSGADELERASAVGRPVAAGDTGQAQVAGEAARLEVDGGDNEDAGHTPLAGVEPESFSGRSAVLAASFARSHAA